MQLQASLYVLDLAAVFVFALSGGLAAARKQLDIVGFIVVGMLTGIGGGTLRDLLIGVRPVFWVFQPEYLLSCTLGGILAFFAAPRIERRLRALSIADAFGLALGTVIGTQKALDYAAPEVVAVLMGVLTAAAGGIARDVLCNEIPLILRREIYALAAVLGGSVYLLIQMADGPRWLALAVAVPLTFAIRVWAVLTKASLPSYGGRPPEG
ncbi:MAG TPA: trimeric intracellular cation channel family protein [Alphaproteobacteria bacterium]|nr:trimeric intracellular cation channel family protein [Alphaproteobacteria bacterium]